YTDSDLRDLHSFPTRRSSDLAGLAPIVLGYLFVTGLMAKISEPYEGYPTWFLAIFGWGMVIGLVVLALLLSLLPWSGRSRAKDDPDYDDFRSEERRVGREGS